MKPGLADIGIKLAIAVVVVGYFGVLIGRLLVANFSDAQGEMVRWTITTVLTSGGALLGLNWYQNQHRYERDQETARADQQTFQKDMTDHINKRLVPIEENLNTVPGLQNEVASLTATQKQLSDDLGKYVYGDLIRRTTGGKPYYNVSTQLRFFDKALSNPRSSNIEKVAAVRAMAESVSTVNREALEWILTDDAMAYLKYLRDDLHIADYPDGQKVIAFFEMFDPIRSTAGAADEEMH